MINRIVKYIFILTALFLFQCRSGDKITYRSSNSIKGSAVKEIESNDKIDHGRTFEIFLQLRNNEDCINVSIISRIFEDSVSKNTPLKIYYIIEKQIDLSGFTDLKKNIQYSEIGRNYDFSWNTREGIDICSSDNPLKRLNKDDILHIRFTGFTEKEFQFTITVRSDYGVSFSEIRSHNE